MHEISQRYYVDEERDGYYVPSMIKRAWSACLEDYLALEAVCKDNGIRVFATWGTLIGAIRHGGFIPWDDDIDVMMLREDYEKLEQIVGKDPERGYHLQDFRMTHQNNIVRQWLNKSVLLYDAEEWEKRHGFPYGSVIDIFILDHIPADEGERLNHARTIGACTELQGLAQELYGEKTLRNPKRESPAFRKKWSETEKLLGHRISFSKDRGAPVWVQILSALDDFLAGYAHRSGADAGVADIPFYLNDRNNRLLPGRYFETAVEVPFEWGTMMVPAGYDSILRRYFGNYQYPGIWPDTHVYPFYEKSKKLLKERFNFEFPTFSIDSKVLDNVENHKCDKETLNNDENRSIETEKSELEYSSRTNTTIDRQIVFLCDRPEHWQWLEPFWREANRDPGNHILVLALPFQYKDAQGLIADNNWEVDTDGYPTEVEVVSGLAYDITTGQPDELYYTFPYDAYDSARMPHPAYFSEFMRDYAETMVLVTPFRLRNIYEWDTHSRYTLGEFLRTPGVLYADRVYVASENTRQIAVELLSGWTGDAVRWEEKIWRTGDYAG